MKKSDKKLCVKYKESSWIELRPFGLAASLEPNRPVLLFKSLCEKHTVGVPLSPIEAGVAMSQNQLTGPSSSPHGLSLKALKKLKLRPVSCYFKQVKGHFLYVDVEFDGHENLTRIEARADEAISFCMRAGTRFYSNLEMIQKCKELEAFNLQESSVTQQQILFENSKNKHPYLM